jgi:hypothetical protein
MTDIAGAKARPLPTGDMLDKEIEPLSASLFSRNTDECNLLCDAGSRMLAPSCPGMSQNLRTSASLHY